MMMMMMMMMMICPPAISMRCLFDFRFEKTVHSGKVCEPFASGELCSTKLMLRKKHLKHNTGIGFGWFKGHYPKRSASISVKSKQRKPGILIAASDTWHTGLHDQVHVQQRKDHDG